MDYKNVIKDIDLEIKRLGDARRVLIGLNGKDTRSAPRTMSAAGRRRIAAAQRKRWAKIRAAKK